MENQEPPRRMVVFNELFEALYNEGDQLLHDCMDLSTATGMRLTDCINVLMSRSESLRLEANKTGKEAAYDLNVSKVLPGLIASRKAIKAAYMLLLSTMDGKRPMACCVTGTTRPETTRTSKQPMPTMTNLCAESGE